MTDGAGDNSNGVGKLYLVDSYKEFVEAEGIPLVTGFSADCLTLPLEPWERLGGLGAYVQLDGTGDYADSYLVEIPAGGQLKPEQHLFDEVLYVASGHGATAIELPNGKRETFEWGVGSLFAIPLNAPHQHFNGSGSESARLYAETSLPIYLNLTHSRDFIFGCSHVFDDRYGDESFFRGEGKFRSIVAGRHQWESVFIPNLASLELQGWAERGAGGKSIQIILAESTLHAHVSEFPQGTYKKAHRKPSEAGVNIMCVTGEGYTLLWEEDENPVESIRVDWKPGTIFANGPGRHFHQHFNTASFPARYLALGFGGMRYPVTKGRRWAYDTADKPLNDGGRQIEYDGEDPRILALFEEELAKRGLESRMSDYIGVKVGR